MSGRAAAGGGRTPRDPWEPSQAQPGPPARAGPTDLIAASLARHGAGPSDLDAEAPEILGNGSEQRGGRREGGNVPDHTARRPAGAATAQGQDRAQRRCRSADTTLPQGRHGRPAEAGERRGPAPRPAAARRVRGGVLTPAPSPELAPLPGELHGEQAPRELGRSPRGRNAGVGTEQGAFPGAGQRHGPLPRGGTETERRAPSRGGRGGSRRWG